MSSVFTSESIHSYDYLENNPFEVVNENCETVKQDYPVEVGGYNDSKDGAVPDIISINNQNNTNINNHSEIFKFEEFPEGPNPFVLSDKKNEKNNSTDDQQQEQKKLHFNFQFQDENINCNNVTIQNQQKQQLYSDTKQLHQTYDQFNPFFQFECNNNNNKANEEQQFSNKQNKEIYNNLEEEHIEQEINNQSQQQNILPQTKTKTKITTTTTTGDGQNSNNAQLNQKQLFYFEQHFKEMIDQVKRKQQDAQHMIYNQIHEKQKNNIDNEKIQIQLKTQTNIKEDQKNLEDEDEGIDGCKNYKNQISKKENEVQEIGAQEYIHSSRSLNSKQKLEYFDEEEEEEEEDYYNEDQDNFNYSEIDEIETIFNGDDEDTDRHTNFTSDISRQFCDFSNDFSSTTSGSSSTFQFQQQQQKSQKQQQYYNFQPTLMQKQLQFKEYSDKIAQFKAQVQKLNAYVKFCEQQIRYFYEKQQNLNLPPNLQIFNSNEKNEQSQLQQNLNISTEDEEKQIFLKNEQFLKLKSKKKNNNISNNNLLILPHLDSNNNNDDAISIISEVDSSSNNTSFYSQQEFAYSPNQQSLRKKQQNCQQSMSLIRKQMQKHDQQNVENQIKQVDKEILRLKQLQCEDLKCKLLQGLSSSSSSTTTTNSIDKNCDDEDDDNSVTGKKQFIKSLSATSNKLSSFSKKIEKPQTINVKSLSQCEEYPKANEKRGRKRKSSQVSTIQHESSSNQSIQLISCRIKGCTFICSKPVVLHKHMKDAHNQVDGIQGEYICTICSQYFHIELSFKRHLKLMHGIQV